MPEPLTADDRAAVDGWYALAQRCAAHDTPELPPVGRLRHATALRSSRSFACRAWMVRDGAEVVAVASLVLPLRDNRHHGFASVLVDVPCRRRGLGTRLLRHVTAQARADGRSHLAIDVDEPLDAPGSGAAFLRATGARLGMTELRRRLTLPAAALPAPSARGYRLVQWTGATPPRWRAALAPLVAGMSTDAPQGEFRLDAQRWDADRVRERDEAELAAGETMVVSAAQAADGTLAAYTEIAVTADDDPAVAAVARQDDTLVAPEHRGHRLGLWLKLANLDRLAAAHPRVRAVDTWNADDNRYMIAINDALGFVPLSRVTDWSLDLAQVGSTAAISAPASGP